MEIRDTKTQGLTGPLRIDDMPSDDHGNFFKLILIQARNKPKQEQEETGASVKVFIIESEWVSLFSIPE